MEAEPTDLHGEVVAVDPRVRRGVLVALFVALLVVVVAVASGGGGTSTEGPDTTESVPTSFATTTEPATDVIEDDGPGAAATPSTTTTIQFSDDKGAFAENPTESILMLWTFNDTRVVVVEVDSGRATSVDLTTLGVDTVKNAVGLGDGFAIETRSGVSLVDPLKGTFRQLTAGGSVLVWGDDELWISTPYPGGDSFVPIRVDLAGEHVELPAVPPKSGPFGFVGDDLLVGGGPSGGVYSGAVGAPTYELLSPGALLASSADTLLVRVCGETLDCSIERHDIALDQSTSQDVPAALNFDALWWIESQASPELDAYLVYSEPAATPVIWEMESDETVSLPITQSRSIGWGVNDDWLFIAGVNEVLAFHRPTLAITRITPDLEMDLAEGMQIAVASL
ncbi:MAG: hypothetical protein GY708_30055 [Actinomycetia bacterium]|nr:hypothetical protein [Actinomycetes bacterium]